MTMANEENGGIYFVGFGAEFGFGWKYRRDNFPEEKTCRACAPYSPSSTLRDRKLLCFNHEPRTNLGTILFVSDTRVFFFIIGLWHLLGVGQLVAVVSVRRRNYQHRRSNASAQNLPNNSKQKPSIKNWQKKGFLARETVFKP